MTWTRKRMRILRMGETGKYDFIVCESYCLYSFWYTLYSYYTTIPPYHLLWGNGCITLSERDFLWLRPTMAKIYLVVPTEDTSQLMIGWNSATTKGSISILALWDLIRFLVAALHLFATSPAWKCKLVSLSWWVFNENYPYQSYFRVYHLAHSLFSYWMYLNLQKSIRTAQSLEIHWWIRSSAPQRMITKRQEYRISHLLGPIDTLLNLSLIMYQWRCTSIVGIHSCQIQLQPPSARFVHWFQI